MNEIIVERDPEHARPLPPKWTIRVTDIMTGTPTEFCVDSEGEAIRAFSHAVDVQARNSWVSLRSPDGTVRGMLVRAARVA